MINLQQEISQAQEELTNLANLTNQINSKENCLFRFDPQYLNKAVLQTLSKKQTPAPSFDLTKRSYNIQIPGPEQKFEPIKQTSELLHLNEQLSSLKLTQFRFDARVDSQNNPIRDRRSRILSAQIRQPDKSKEKSKHIQSSTTGLKTFSDYESLLDNKNLTSHICGSSINMKGLKSQIKVSSLVSTAS